MDLSTQYLGLKLDHPLMPGASPLVDDLDAVRQLEDAGAAAIVMHSLFEEQIVGEQLGTYRATEVHAESFAEALSYLPRPDEFVLGPDDYLDQLAAVKAAVSVPVIASLNGSSLGGWLEYAKLMEDAGADAIELNIYDVPTDPDQNAAVLEDRVEQILQVVKGSTSIPVCLKLSQFYTCFAQFARRLDAAGADGLVLFNRFYQPDIDVDELEVAHSLSLSDSSELLLRLRWLAIVSGHVQCSLAVTGGVHTALDAVKAVMCGAHAVQMVSALLRHGPGYLAKVRADVEAWLEQNEYDSLGQMQASMNLMRCPDPHAYERANYIHVLQSWWRENPRV